MNYFQRMTDMALFLSADCGCDGLADPGDCACAPAYACHHARRELSARDLDLAKVRRKVERVAAELRKLPEMDLTMIAIGDDVEGLWRLALQLLAGKR